MGNTQRLLVLKLEVVSVNKKARRLYEKFGFEEEGRLKNGVKIGDGYEDIVLMAKTDRTIIMR